MLYREPFISARAARLLSAGLTLLAIIHPYRLNDLITRIINQQIRTDAQG
jgi:hypothetical protein